MGQVTSGRPYERTDASTHPGTSEPAAAPEPLWKPPESVPADSFEEEDELPVSKGRPLPRKPLPGQLRAPCPHPYTEMNGVCWKETLYYSRNGTIAPCPEKSYEVNGKCFVAVADDKVPNSVKPGGDAGVP